MNLLSSNADEPITEQAVNWFMRLQEKDCTQAERKAFDEWLSSNYKHTVAYEKTRKIWDVSAQLAPTLSVPSLQHLQAEPQEQQYAQQAPQPATAPVDRSVLHTK